jgi:hypothetical protein
MKKYNVTRNVVIMVNTTSRNLIDSCIDHFNITTLYHFLLEDIK